MPLSDFFPSEKRKIANVNAQVEIDKALIDAQSRAAQARTLSYTELSKAAMEDSLKRSAMRVAGREMAGAELGSPFSYGGAAGLKPSSPTGGWTSPVGVIRGTETSWAGGPMQEFNSPLRAQQNINRVAGLGEYVPEDKPNTWEPTVDAKGDITGFASSASPIYRKLMGEQAPQQQRPTSPLINAGHEPNRLLEKTRDAGASPQYSDMSSPFTNPEDPMYDNSLARLYRWLKKIAGNTEPTESRELY